MGPTELIHIGFPGQMAMGVANSPFGGACRRRMRILSSRVDSALGTSHEQRSPEAKISKRLAHGHASAIATYTLHCRK